MTSSQRLAALGPQPPWWRPFKRRRWRVTAQALCHAIVAEMVEQAIARAWEGMQGKVFGAVEKQGEVN